MAVLLMGLYFIVSYVSDDALQERKNQLISYNEMINNLFKNKDEFNFSNNNLKVIAKTLGVRVTAIDTSGKVFYDSTFFDEKSLENVENHAGRPEVKAAIQNGYGFDMRLSATVGINYLYCAKLVMPDYIIRVSFPYKTIQHYLINLRYHIILIFLLLLVAVFALSYYFAKKLSLPVENLNDMINKIEQGKTPDLDKYISSSDEISRLTTRFYNNMAKREKELLDEKEKLNSVLSALSDGVALLSSNWLILYANDKYVEMFGKETKDLINEIKDFETLKLFSELRQKGDGKHFTKYKNRFYEITVRSFNDYKIVVFHDTTDQMRYHMFKSELVANISHELKTPVSIIMGYAETLLNSENEMDQATKEKFAKKLYDSSIRLDNLISDIIHLHSLESMDRNFSVDTNINTIELKSELKEIYRDAAKNIIFNFEVADIQIIKEHLLSIFKNLIDNAVTYSAGDNVYVSIKKAGSKVILTVDDEGPLIPEDERGKIFERFYTSSKSRNKKHSGTGLGLSIVKHTAELYNGYVELLKNIYGGNCFKVVLQEKLQWS
jgi:two-component system phosphate regulon sensor histidine kinase PhoR